MIPQAYPLWITMIDNDVRDPEEIKGARAKMARLSAATYRVIGWIDLDPDPDFEPKMSPVIVASGVPNPRAYPIGEGEEGAYHFYGDTRLQALSQALESCYPKGLPPDAVTTLHKYA